jgi:hypothetical protein
MYRLKTTWAGENNCMNVHTANYTRLQQSLCTANEIERSFKQRMNGTYLAGTVALGAHRPLALAVRNVRQVPQEAPRRRR